MTRWNGLVCGAFAILALTVALRASEPTVATMDASRGYGGQAAQAIQSQYVGSSSCERCHAKEHAAWKDSLHIKMTKPIAEAAASYELAGAPTAEATSSATAEATSSAKSEAEKRERGILKKLRQALAVQQEHAQGKQLNEAQQAKVQMASDCL